MKQTSEGKRISNLICKSFVFNDIQLNTVWFDHTHPSFDIACPMTMVHLRRENHKQIKQDLLNTGKQNI